MSNYKVTETYDNYESYIEHQASKLDKKPAVCTKFDKLIEAEMDEFLDKYKIENKSSVLCLAARLGGEVRAFIKHGFFAVGIDLNPGQNNRFVLSGDFHDIQFPDHSVDIIFTNSMDHSLYIDKLLSEINRVLKPDGLLITKIPLGFKENNNHGFSTYEVSQWKRVSDVLELMVKNFGIKESVQLKDNNVHIFTPKKGEQNEELSSVQNSATPKID